MPGFLTVRAVRQTPTDRFFAADRSAQKSDPLSDGERVAKPKVLPDVYHQILPRQDQRRSAYLMDAYTADKPEPVPPVAVANFAPEFWRLFTVHCNPPCACSCLK